MSIILLMHEQMFNDPWLNISTLFTNIECIIRMNRKGHKNVHLWFQQTWLKNVFFLLMMMRARESKTLLFLFTRDHHHFLLQLHLPKFCSHCFSLKFKQSWCCWYNFWTELLKVQAFQVCSLLITVTSNLGICGHYLASLVFIACDPPGHGPHVDHHFHFPPF